KVTSISQFLQHPSNRAHLTFNLYTDGYETSNSLFGIEATQRPTLARAGWNHRRTLAKYEEFRREEEKRQKTVRDSMSRPQSDFDPNVADPTEESTAVPGVQKNKVNHASGKAESAPDKNPSRKPPLPMTAPGRTGTVPTPPQKPIPPAPIPTTSEPQGSASSGFNPYDAALKNLPSAPNYSKPVQGKASEKAEGTSSDDTPSRPALPQANPLDQYDQFKVQFDKATQQETGIIVGMGLVSGLRRRVKDEETGKEVFRESLTVVPGDDVTLSFLAVGTENALPSIVYDRFTITDLYECRMSEYDCTFVFVPIAKLQQLRKMIAEDGTKLATHILIKAKPGVDINVLRDRLQESDEFPPQLYQVETWRDKQATILAAVATELSILNVLLFLIIAVAGFGILAIFFMIVVEKTKDIGILKSLGAGGYGIMQIFLFYGLALGIVGSGIGLVIGLTFVHNINAVARFLSKIMGHEVFDPSVYMFQQVPAIVEPWTVFWIMFGAITIAVVSGVLPAIRAAKLHPVDALRV
ncbi:MAG: FtsX-like permease family protein, partial [Planctomycetia bacterium]|nr:FtsX-like permease family protein [Planctomycetia bacterium]